MRKLIAPAPVTIAVTTTDACDDNPAIELVSITSNEGSNVNGSGHTSSDFQGAAFGADDRQFLLRAERSAQDGGRIYTITYKATDKSGNATTSAVTVTVPKNQANPQPIVRLGRQQGRRFPGAPIVFRRRVVRTRAAAVRRAAATESW